MAADDGPTNEVGLGPHQLVERTREAMNAGDLLAAEALARELLARIAGRFEEWWYGNAVHLGHSVLGRVALAGGDIQRARAELIEAGATPGSPQLETFGPNVTLAAGLLEAGEVDTVLHYFEQCRLFWEMGHDRLDRWAEDIKAGRAPQFGANLRYLD